MTDDVEIPESEEEGKEFVPPSDGSWVPRDRMNEAVERERQAAEAERQKSRELEARLSDLEKKVETSKEAKEYSRAELLNYVEQGQVSQAEAEQLWEQQLERKIERRARETAEQLVAGSTKEQRIDQEIARYAQALPAIMKDGSEERARVAEEYRYLVNIGQPNSKATELAALRAVFGSPDRLQTKQKKETHQETGGAAEEEAGNKDGTPKGMSAREREYYSERIKMGIYKGWDDVKAELKYKRASA